LKYLNYENLVEVFNDLVLKYLSTVNRVWPDSPIYTEIDTFLDFLYHHNGQPSNEYKDKGSRSLNYNLKLKEIRKYFREFKIYADDDMLEWRKEGTRLAHKYLSQR